MKNSIEHALLSPALGLWLRVAAARADRRDRGATAVEYALIIATIAAVIIAALVLLGDSTSDNFQRPMDEMP